MFHPLSPWPRMSASPPCRARPADRLRQTTGEQIIARRSRPAAKRQASSAPICSRPVTGTTPHAVITNGYFYTDHSTTKTATSPADCFSICEQDAS